MCVYVKLLMFKVEEKKEFFIRIYLVGWEGHDFTIFQVLEVS